MKNKIILLLIALLLSATVIHAAKPTRYELNVKDFAELSVIEGINVDYRCNPDSAGKAVFTTTPDLASVLMFSNEKGKLELQIATEGIVHEGLPLVTVYSSTLSKVVNSGDSTVRVINMAPYPKFQAQLMGNGRLVVHNIDSPSTTLLLTTGRGTIVADGKTDNLSIRFSGTGTIEADKLRAECVKIKAGGTGAIGCCPLKMLDIFGIGSTSIYYKGTPSIKNRSVGLKLLPLE